MIDVLDFLSIQKVFQERPPDLSKEGLYFETIAGNFVVDKGVFSTESLIMKSPILNVAGQGHIDIPKKWIDFDLGVQPLGTVDSLVSHIPVIGHIFVGKEKSPSHLLF